jgi:hypothetical protein
VLRLTLTKRRRVDAGGAESGGMYPAVRATSTTRMETAARVGMSLGDPEEQVSKVR